jgi:peptidoglycan hydrolase-like protein with peptidoglycan-binding domain
LRDISSGPDKIALTKYQALPGAMTVAAVQQALQTGFFPGGSVYGICGYRTHSAIRLFQEYVRSVEKPPDCLPDGRFGPKGSSTGSGGGGRHSSCVAEPHSET